MSRVGFGEKSRFLQHQLFSSGGSEDESVENVKAQIIWQRAGVKGRVIRGREENKPLSHVMRPRDPSENSGKLTDRLFPDCGRKEALKEWGSQNGTNPKRGSEGGDMLPARRFCTGRPGADCWPHLSAGYLRQTVKGLRQRTVGRHWGQ